MTYAEIWKAKKAKYLKEYNRTQKRKEYMKAWRASHKADIRKYHDAHYAEHKVEYIARAQLTIQYNKQKVSKLREQGRCLDCDSKGTDIPLEYHHLRDKVSNISRMVIRHTWPKIEHEIAKCVLLCKLCHQKRHLRSKQC